MPHTVDARGASSAKNAHMPLNEFEHHIICPVCGEGVDCADVAEVIHHGDRSHRRPMNDRRVRPI
ncbi:MAG: hypothetical protein WDM79_06990 [Terricaulis sp.]